ncbi:peptidase [Sporosarcina sp. P37]|uniref:S9 family peptidase n=1 Tax=unclassified Sporosarcina TaxID=2647733 RepID=UPI000A17D0DC|nr:MULTISPECIES: S9 family peptidase [unclassified Sporosarcina]ARK25499.1 peptidase [Sporosarcina sp. P37]PID17970.1 S9 family peptidase [Sporosarcina sp. P35]
MEKRCVAAEDLFETKSVTNPVLAPNNQEAAVTVTKMNREDNTYYSAIHHIDLQTGNVTQWTFGKQLVSAAKWSADGRQLAFLSNRTGTNQLYVMQKAGGEARVLTDCKEGIDSFEWSPCGKKIWFTGTIRTGETFATTVKKEETFPQPIRVTKMKYKADFTGVLPQDQHAQIGYVDLATCAVCNFTAEPFDHSLEAVSHDGKYLVIGVNRKEQTDYDFSTPLVLVEIETRDETVILDQQGYFGKVQFSKDDRYIAYTGFDMTYQNVTQTDVFVYDRTDGLTMNLTAGIDAPVGDECISDHLQQLYAPGVVWTDDEQLYFQLSSMGDVRLYAATLDGAIYPATGEEEHVYGYDVSSTGEFALVAVSTATNPGELYLQTIATGERKALTSCNEGWLKKVRLVTPETIHYTNGDMNIQGWLMKPANFKEGSRYPLIVEIHGGPHAMYGCTYFHEMQLLAAEGYGVLYLNPRGSHGYSQEFVDAVRGDYGGAAYEDIMAGVDEVLANETWIDETRLGVTGGSYGGFMTNWIVGHTNRFKAAVTQRSISNWISFFGVSDIGYYFTEWHLKADMRDADTLWKHSPLKYAEQVETPLLILHAERDFTCPIEQAEQLFITLKDLGKETEFVRFPESDHNLSRTGKPNLRIARLQEITGWFRRYL